MCRSTGCYSLLSLQSLCVSKKPHFQTNDHKLHEIAVFKVLIDVICAKTRAWCPAFQPSRSIIWVLLISVWQTLQTFHFAALLRGIENGTNSPIIFNFSSTFLPFLSKYKSFHNLCFAWESTWYYQMMCMKNNTMQS